MSILEELDLQSYYWDKERIEKIVQKFLLLSDDEL